MLASVVLTLTVTGITAIVPSARDKNVTHLIAQSYPDMSPTHPMIPEHYAFLEVHSKNLVPGARAEYLRYHDANDANDDYRLVFILRSEEIKFGTAPTNRTLVRNTTIPKNGLTQPKGDRELTSTVYELDLSKLCPSCKAIGPEYFDLAAHPDKVALRMDLLGGRERVRGLQPGLVWYADNTPVKQPLTQQVVFEFDIPGSAERLLLSRVPRAGDKPIPTTIDLASPDGKPIEVTLGNAPLVSILKLDANYKGEHRDDHFALFYDMITPAPLTRPVLKTVPRPKDKVFVTGPKDNCIPSRHQPQDPK